MLPFLVAKNLQANMQNNWKKMVIFAVVFSTIWRWKNAFLFSYFQAKGRIKD